MRTWWAGLLAVLCVYAMVGLGTPQVQNPGEHSRLSLAVSLSDFGSVSIDPVLDAYGAPFDRAQRGGRTYSDKAPGVSLASVPVVVAFGPLLPRQEGSTVPDYWPLRHLLVLLLVALPAALFPFLALRRFSGVAVERRAAIALVFALCTPLFTYGVVLLSHVPAGLLAALACALILRPGEARGVPTPKAAAVAGLALAAAVTTEYPIALFGLVLGPTLVLRRAPARTVAVFVLAGVIGLVPCLVYHHLAFGSVLGTGYGFKADPWHAIVHGEGVMGVTLPTFERLWGVLGSARRGVFFYCPLLLLVPLGLRAMARSQTRSAWPFVALTALYVFFAAGFVDWQAGWSAAARHLLPLVLVSIYPLAAGVEDLAGRRRWRWLLLPLVALSLTGAVLSIGLSPFFPEHFSSPLGQLVLPMLSQGFAAPTLAASAALEARPAALAVTVLVAFVATSWGVMTLVGARRAWLPAVLFGLSVGWAGLLWSTAPPLAYDVEQARSQVLDRVGYDQHAREARGVDVPPY